MTVTLMGDTILRVKVVYVVVHYMTAVTWLALSKGFPSSCGRIFTKDLVKASQSK